MVVPDLLHMFTHDPNIDPKEAKYLIKEIVSDKENSNTVEPISMRMFLNIPPVFIQ